MSFYSVTKDPTHLEDAIVAFRTAVGSQSSSVLARFRAGKFWAVHSDSSHQSALEAYQQTIDLPPRLTTLDMNLVTRQETLSRTTGLACNAGCAMERFTKPPPILFSGQIN